VFEALYYRVVSEEKRKTFFSSFSNVFLTDNMGCLISFFPLKIVFLVLSCLMFVQCVYTFIFGLIPEIQESVVSTYLLVTWVYVIGSFTGATGLLGIAEAILVLKNITSKVLPPIHLLLSVTVLAVVVAGYAQSIVYWQVYYYYFFFNFFFFFYLFIRKSKHCVASTAEMWILCECLLDWECRWDY
jgi:hypothetical protein